MTGPIKGAGEGFAAFSNRLPRVFLAAEVNISGHFKVCSILVVSAVHRVPQGGKVR